MLELSLPSRSERCTFKVAECHMVLEAIIIVMIIVHVVQKKERKKVLSTSNSVNHELNIRPSKLNIRES